MQLMLTPALILIPTPALPCPRFAARSVLSTIETACPSLAPAALTIDFPVWKDVPPLPDTAAAFGGAALEELHAAPRELP